MYHIVIGVTSDVGVPSTYLVDKGNIEILEIYDNLKNIAQSFIVYQV